MINIYNPFIIKGYRGSELFCDRKNELGMLLKNAQNGLDTTLISPRRMGKTGLLMRFFDYIKAENIPFETIYIDIYASRSFNDFVRILAEGILKKFPEKTSLGKKFMRVLKGFRPIISYDPISGEARIQLIFQSWEEQEHTLQGLLAFLDEQNMSIILVIDEFQQILDYPEENTEALLRTCMQSLKNIHFIFCGSRKTMMTDIFSNSKRPFYASTSYIALDKIEASVYAKFIKQLFEKYKRIIDDASIEFILTWSKCHTYYTQCVCNMLFSMGEKNIRIEEVKKCCVQIIKQQEAVFLQYRQLLTHAQWNYLIAVAKEDVVEQITAQKFLQTYQIGTPANARRLNNALIDKELILAVENKKTTVYQVYDVFLSRWLQTEYC